MSIKTMMAAAVLAAATAVNAGSFTLRSDLTGDVDWTSKDSYQNAAAAPAAGDTVTIPANASATLKSTDTASWTLVSSLAKVWPGDGAQLTVEVAEGSAELGCAISWYNKDDATTAASSTKGWLVKTGAGELVFARTPSLKYSSIYRDFAVNMDIQAGAVKLPGALATKYNLKIGDLKIAKDAAFYPFAWQSGVQDSDTTCYALSGEGAIKSENKVRIKLTHEGYSGKASTFAGSVVGKVWITASINRVDFTGTFDTCTTDSTRVSGNGVLGFANDSLFKSGNLGGEGTFLYIGDTDILINRGVWYLYPFTFDAGAHGGVAWSGEISQGLENGTAEFVLSGNSANESEFSGYFREGTSVATSNGVVHLVKRGTGTWKISSPASKNALHSTVDVENGILKFTTLAEKGTQCSLGDATKLYKNEKIAIDKATAVDWAFLLGGAATEGIMEYVGTTSASCSQRPVAVKSVGGVYASQTNGESLVMAGFSAAEAGGTKTLVLGGTNADGNKAKDITDGAADRKLGLEKRGIGTWRLQGTQSFSGPLNVKQGVLEVDNTPVGTPYRYFRLYLKENAFSACENGTDEFFANVKTDDCLRWKNESGKYQGENELRWVQFARWYLLDCNGNMAVSNCTTKFTKDHYVTAKDLAENEFTFTGSNLPDSGTRDGNQGSENIFVNGNGIGDLRFTHRFTVQPKLSDSTTWGCIELRIPNDAPEICGYDIFTRNAKYDGTFSELSGRGLVSWEVHGSVDGSEGSYVKLDERNSNHFVDDSDGAYWMYDPLTMSWMGFPRTNDKFFKFATTKSATAGATPNPLANVESIEVAPGAALKVRGAKYEISSLVIDKDGAGMMSNVTFAATGKIAFKNHNEHGAQTYPIDTSIEGFQNLKNWSFSVNGKDTGKGKITLSDTGVVFHDLGFTFVIR